jgi:hypothetical protein
VVERETMGRVRPLLALVAGAAALAALIVAVWPSGGRSNAHPPPVSATLSPRATLFGDPVVAQLAVPNGSRVDASFAPYTVRSVTHQGGTYTYRLECLSIACVPGRAGARTVTLAPAVVRVSGRRPVAIAWPPLRIGSRLSAGDLRHPAFRADVTSPRASSRIDPDALGWGLTSIAGALVLAASAWAALRLRPRQRTLQLVPDLQPEPSALEKALEAVEQSLGGPPERRRAALDALAVAVADEQLAVRARTLAWSPHEPEPPAMRLLAYESRESAE